MKICFVILALLFAFVTCLAQTPPNGIGTGDSSAFKHPRIQSKPEPNWPKTIKTQVECTIVLRAVFSKDAKVTDVHLYQVRPEKPGGLTKAEIKDLIKKATNAAHQIKFIT